MVWFTNPRSGSGNSPRHESVRAATKYFCRLRNSKNSRLVSPRTGAERWPPSLDSTGINVSDSSSAEGLSSWVAILMLVQKLWAAWRMAEASLVNRSAVAISERLSRYTVVMDGSQSSWKMRPLGCRPQMQESSSSVAVRWSFEAVSTGVFRGVW